MHRYAKSMAHYFTGTLTVAIACLLLFAGLAHENAEGDFVDWNQMAFEWAQRQAVERPWLSSVAQAVTRTGDWLGYALGLGVLGWVRRRHGDGAQLRCFVLLLLGCPALIIGLKLLYALPRPDVPGQTTSFAFPSGHTLYATCLYGYLGISLVENKRRVGWLLVLWPVAVAWSRVMLSRHWLTDVVGGALIGSAWVGWCLYLRSRARKSGDGSRE